MTAPASRHRLTSTGLRTALVAALGVALLASPLVTLPATTAAAADFVPGHQTRFPLPDANAKPTGIVTGADGALWIAESNGHAIVRMATDGTTKRYPIPSGASPTDLAAGADGTIWWVSSTGNSTGHITSAGEVVEDVDGVAGADPAAVTVASDGSAWFTRPGAFYKLWAERSPSNPSGFQGLIEIGHGVTAPTSVESIGGKIWVSDAAANLIVILSQTGVFEKSITVPGPSAMTEGDGAVYVVSAGNGIVKVRLDGVPVTGAEWHDPGTPLITDVVVPAPGEQWFTKLRDKQVTVRSQVDGIPPVVDLPDATTPSDLTVGPDGAIWYTALDSGEVVRIARDFEAPGIGVGHRADAPPILGYRGEPLGPVALNDRGSGTVYVDSGGSVPAGMSIDAGHPQIVDGRPTSTDAARLAVSAVNAYYGGTEAVSVYQQSFLVREKPAVQRIGGTDRYEAAVNASRSRFPSAAARVYVASGEKFADALSAGPVAIAAGAPLLLTTAGALPAAVEAELKRLNPSSVVVVGGPASVSDGVVAQIAGAVGRTASVTRIGGPDRYEVSRKLVETGPPSTTLYLASGLNYPDALSAAPVASQGKNSVLLVDGSQARLPDATMAFLVGRGVTTVKLAGGAASLSDGIKAQLEAARIQVVRLGGASRYDTSVIVNRDVLAQPGVDSRIPSNPVPLVHSDVVYLASGENYPDALAGGVAAGLEKAPLYITPKNCVPRTVLLDIGSTGATKVVVLGGPNTLAAPVESLTVCP